MSKKQYPLDRKTSNKIQYDDILSPAAHVGEAKKDPPITVLIVDDHKLVRQGLRNMIESQDDMTVEGEAEDGREAVKLTREMRPDVVLMDFNMPEMNGIKATQKITEEQSQQLVIGLSLYEKTVVADKMKSAGATAFLTKTEGVDALCSAIRDEAR